MGKRWIMRRIIMQNKLFLLAGVIVVLMFPMSITKPERDLEDVKKYVTALEIQQRKEMLQKTLAEGEEVIEMYSDVTSDTSFGETRYFQVQNTCNWEFVGSCVPIMTGPGFSYPRAMIHYENQGSFVASVRAGQIFGVTALLRGRDGDLWYKIVLKKKKYLFPQRIRGDWYVPVNHFTRIDFSPIHPERDKEKHIRVVLHEQRIYAYEGDKLFQSFAVSTGREALDLATDQGSFHILSKTPMAIMEGPLPSMIAMVDEENLPDFEYTLFVPYAMAFSVTDAGVSFIHGAYWHNGFGAERSHGCVNVSPHEALMLYRWTPDPSIVKIPVTIVP